jgi:hypothetical protein
MRDHHSAAGMGGLGRIQQEQGRKGSRSNETVTGYFAFSGRLTLID